MIRAIKDKKNALDTVAIYLTVLQEGEQQNYQNQHFICNFRRKVRLAYRFCLHCAVEERALGNFQQPSNEGELEKPQEQHLSHEDIGNASGYTAGC